MGLEGIAVKSTIGVGLGTNVESRFDVDLEISVESTLSICLGVGMDSAFDTGSGIRAEPTFDVGLEFRPSSQLCNNSAGGLSVGFFVQHHSNFVQSDRI